MNRNSKSEMKPRLNRGSVRASVYVAILVTLLVTINGVFGWASVDDIPSALQPYRVIIVLIHPYISYIQAGLVLVFGYLTVNALSYMVYAHLRR